MHAAGTPKSKQLFCEINITPLTDIFLVLLTIMMIVAPLVRQMNGEIQLPEIAKGNEVNKEGLTIEVTQDGHYFIESVPVPEDALPQILQTKLPGLTQKKIVVQADLAVKSRYVLAVFRAAEDAGYEKMTVVGKAAKDEEPEKPSDETEPTS